MVRMRPNVEGASAVVEPFTVRKCRLNQTWDWKRTNEMIPKVWLAAFLGVLLGLGMTYATSVPVTPAANMKLPAQTFEVNRQTHHYRLSRLSQILNCFCFHC